MLWHNGYTLSRSRPARSIKMLYFCGASALLTPFLLLVMIRHRFLKAWTFQKNSLCGRLDLSSVDIFWNLFLGNNKVHPSNHPSTHPSTHPATHPSTVCFHPSIYLWEWEFKAYPLYIYKNTFLCSFTYYNDIKHIVQLPQGFFCLRYRGLITEPMFRSVIDSVGFGWGLGVPCSHGWIIAIASLRIAAMRPQFSSDFLCFSLTSSTRVIYSHIRTQGKTCVESSTDPAVLTFLLLRLCFSFSPCPLYVPLLLFGIVFLDVWFDS